MYHLSLYKLAIGPSCIIVKFTHFEWVYLSELFFHQKMFENLHMHVFYFRLKLMNTTKKNKTHYIYENMSMQWMENAISWSIFRWSKFYMDTFTCVFVLN